MPLESYLTSVPVFLWKLLSSEQGIKHAKVNLSRMQRKLTDILGVAKKFTAAFNFLRERESERDLTKTAGIKPV